MVSVGSRLDGGRSPAALPTVITYLEATLEVAMNDLATLEQDTISKLLAELKKDFEISSWADFERRFLLGTGKSKNTIASYRDSCKQFFDFTGGQHPWAVATPEHIEQWYDSMDGLSLNTRSLRIKGIRFMYRRMAERYPTAFEDPFNLYKVAQRCNRDGNCPAQYAEIEEL